MAKKEKKADKVEVTTLADFKTKGTPDPFVDADHKVSHRKDVVTIHNRPYRARPNKQSREAGYIKPHVNNLGT